MQKTIFLFCGDDRFLVNDGARALVNRLVPEAERDFALDVINGDCSTSDEIARAVSSCCQSLQMESFFGGTKTTWLKDASFLGGGAKKSETASQESSSAPYSAGSMLTQAIKQGLPPGHNLVISCKKILRSSALYKAIAAVGEINDFGNDLRPFEKERAASAFVSRRLEELGLKMPNDAREFFIQRVGSDMGMLINELEKLRSFAHPRVELTKDDVASISSFGHETVSWDLLDAFDSRDSRKTLQILAQFEGQRGVGIMLTAMLEKNVREMLALRFAIDRNWIQNGKWAKDLSPEVKVILESSPINPTTYNAWKLGKITNFVKNYTETELRLARHLLNDLREKLVSGNSQEIPLLQRTLLRIIVRH